MMQDKDGVSAAAVFAEMAGSHYRRGTTVAAHLRELYDRWGTGQGMLNQHHVQQTLVVAVLGYHVEHLSDPDDQTFCFAQKASKSFRIQVQTTSCLACNHCTSHAWKGNSIVQLVRTVVRCFMCCAVPAGMVSLCSEPATTSRTLPHAASPCSTGCARMDSTHRCGEQLFQKRQQWRQQQGSDNAGVAGYSLVRRTAAAAVAAAAAPAVPELLYLAACVLGQHTSHASDHAVHAVHNTE
jgi:hypothetical protein